MPKNRSNHPTSVPVRPSALTKSMTVLGQNFDSGSDPQKPTPLLIETGEEQDVIDELDPTRYGDWERNGRCIDF